MDFKQLRTFVTVAELGHMTKAAAVLHIVQPAVSRQIQLLEEDVGAPLFVRSGKGLALTAAGESFLEYARRILHEMQRARAEIDTMHSAAHGAVGGLVTVGLLSSTSALLTSALIELVATRYPNIQLRIMVGYSGHIRQWVDSGDVDFALVYEEPNLSGLQTQAVVQENLWVVGTKAKKLRASHAQSFDWVVQHPLVLPSAPHGLRSLIERAALAKKIKLKVAAETNDLSVQKDLVASGLGLTILPSIAVATEVASGKLCAAPLTDPPITRKVLLATNASRKITPPVRCTLPLLLDCIKATIDQGKWPAAKWLG